MITTLTNSVGYQICSKTIMDTSDPDIVFDDAGVCNHFHEFQARKQTEVLEGEVGERFVTGLAQGLKKEAEKKPYDCVIGLSGGVDSSYVAYVCVTKLGLRPLAIHLDNGWNTDLAVSNIENIVKKLEIDLHTEVLDWVEFRELQKALFRASIGNVEIATDHAINAVLLKTASKFGVRNILSGSNLNTEGILQLGGWGHDNKDWSNIRDINQRHGKFPLKRYPHLSSLDFLYYIMARKTRFIPILNYLDFNKDEAKKILADKLGWRQYDRKHGESTFTRFFQEYYLPEKFSVDKRRSHFSSLICAGQMTRDEALIEIEKPLFSGHEKERLIEFALKKLEFSSSEWGAVMQAPPRPHHDFKTSWLLSNRNSFFYKFGRRIATGRNRI